MASQLSPSQFRRQNGIGLTDVACRGVWHLTPHPQTVDLRQKLLFRRSRGAHLMTPATSANRLPGSRAGAALVMLVLAFAVCELTVLYLPAARPGAIPTVYAT